MITLQRNNSPSQQSTPKGVQFLSPNHVTTEGIIMTIRKVTADKPDNYGNPVVVYFDHGADKYSKGYKLTSDALATLCDLFGADETKWAGQNVRVGKSIDEDGGARLTYAKVAEVSDTPAAQKAKRAR